MTGTLPFLRTRLELDRTLRHRSFFARAVAAGARVVWGVAERQGWRIGRIVDPFGHPWEIGKPL